MPANHAMLDLETFDTAPTAAIVQIGAVRFDPEGIEVANPTWEFERTIFLQSSVIAGGTIDPATVDWWRSQPDAVRENIQGHDVVSLRNALVMFSQWFNGGDPVKYLWSHGLAFDVPILDHAYRSLGLKAPWDFRNLRDTRTLFSLAEGAGWARPRRETAHTALADAIAQAADVQAATAALRAATSPTYGKVPA